VPLLAQLDVRDLDGERLLKGGKVDDTVGRSLDEQA